jgi:predicted nuclease of predicted toxin-antitoxin system
MNPQLVIDMNLPPDWVDWLAQRGWQAVHWSTVGDPSAADSDIMAWAIANGRVVFTHDLDFGTLHALTHATGPSVIQVRTQDTYPDSIGGFVESALTQYASDLAAGALVTVEPSRNRVRILPL